MDLNLVVRRTRVNRKLFGIVVPTFCSELALTASIAMFDPNGKILGISCWGERHAGCLVF
jgi:hypothetical protein